MADDAPSYNDNLDDEIMARFPTLKAAMIKYAGDVYQAHMENSKKEPKCKFNLAYFIFEGADISMVSSYTGSEYYLLASHIDMSVMVLLCDY